MNRSTRPNMLVYVRPSTCDRYRRSAGVRNRSAPTPDMLSGRNLVPKSNPRPRNTSRSISKRTRFDSSTGFAYRLAGLDSDFEACDDVCMEFIRPFSRYDGWNGARG